MPKIEISSASVRTACSYPGALADHCKGRSKVALGDLGGLDQFGVNLTRLAPGAASAHKHWHAKEDELVYMLEGEAVLVEDDGETILRAGDAATFKAGVENGHMIVNRSLADAVFLEVGTRSADEVSSYTDPAVDLKMVKEKSGWRAYRKNGERY
ncbi:cupin domain-containing protein [Hyphococcus sp.]|uniref:cupin domain-containing protein n=1 Tax=Hyphococcus sp. TaxID=2038636 RepID=UPI00207ECC8A|nr:MAG: transcriptional regulator [Marinicaulis sp.]